MLQSEAVYTNVSRGDRALAKDLKACFGTTDQKEICKEILMHGTLQVKKKCRVLGSNLGGIKLQSYCQITGTEREFFHESRTNEVITQLAEMCIDSRTGFPLTKDQISSALQDINYQVVTASRDELSLIINSITILSSIINSLH